MKNLYGKNMTGIWKELCKSMENETNITLGMDGQPTKHRGEYYIHPYDYFMFADSVEAPGLYLEDVGYSTSGAKMRGLLSKYLDEDQVKNWLKFIKKVFNERPEVRGEIYLQTKLQTKVKGGCLVGFMYRHSGDHGVEPTLIVISRSIEMPAKAMADILLISALGKLLCRVLNIKDLRVQWYTTSVVMPGRRAYLYVIYKWPKKVRFANKLYQDYINKGWAKYYLSDFEFSYSTNIRTKKFFERKRAGELKRVSDFQAFYRKLLEYIGEKDDKTE